MSWFDSAAATQELPHVGLDLDGVSWHAAFNRLDEVDTAAHKLCALRLGRLLAAFAPGYVNLAKPRPDDTVDASLARLQAIAALVDEWAAAMETHPHPSAGDEAATGLAADPAGGAPASSTPPAAGDTP